MRKIIALLAVTAALLGLGAIPAQAHGSCTSVFATLDHTGSADWHVEANVQCGFDHPYTWIRIITQRRHPGTSGWNDWDDMSLGYPNTNTAHWAPFYAFYFDPQCGFEYRAWAKGWQENEFGLRENIIGPDTSFIKVGGCG